MLQETLTEIALDHSEEGCVLKISHSVRTVDFRFGIHNQKSFMVQCLILPILLDRQPGILISYFDVLRKVYCREWLSKIIHRKSNVYGIWSQLKVVSVISRS